ncbi:MAG: hypothetical protein KBA46_04885, partial [Candidatus Omnitrophica bacterium]|nr:hypothetical protein [Candidatus Omnitrophota bacterium]
MVSPEIVTRIKKVLQDFNPLSVAQPYADEVRLKVEPHNFKDACFALHKILPSPVMMLFACDERNAKESFVIYCVFIDVKHSK